MRYRNAKGIKCQVNVKRSRFGWLASSNPLLVDAITTSSLSLERLFWRGRRWFPQIPGQNRVSQLGKLQTQGYTSVYVCVCVLHRPLKGSASWYSKSRPDKDKASSETSFSHYYQAHVHLCALAHPPKKEWERESSRMKILTESRHVYIVHFSHAVYTVHT